MPIWVNKSGRSFHKGHSMTQEALSIRIKRRHELSSSKIKKFITALKELYGSKIVSLIEQAGKIELVETEQGTFYVINKKALFLEKNSLIIPTVKMAQEWRDYIKLPEVIVDMGAVPYVVRGARIMRPGIVSISNLEIKKGQIVQILDEKNRAVLAIGRLELDGRDIQQKQKGPVIENLTWVGDAYWDLSL